MLRLFGWLGMRNLKSFLFGNAKLEFHCGQFLGSLQLGLCYQMFRSTEVSFLARWAIRNLSYWLFVVL